MGKLSVLGAQRIKALEGMLDEKMQEELDNVKPATVDSSVVARKAVGIDKDYDKAVKLIEQANDILQNIISPATGDAHSASMNFSSNYRMKTEYKKIRDDVAENTSGKKEREEIKKRYARKKQMLWLCETLEEAKDIVGIE